MEVMAEVRLQLQDTGHERVHLRRLGNLEELCEQVLQVRCPMAPEWGKDPTG
jgi:hypothetical protein